MEMINIMRQNLIDFMTWKSKTIQSRLHTRLKIFCQSDRKDLESWDNPDIIRAYIRIQNQLYREYPQYLDSDAYLCPWCHKYTHKPCSKCTYGLRWGLCGGFNYVGKFKKLRKLNQRVNNEYFLCTVYLAYKQDIEKARSFFFN